MPTISEAITALTDRLTAGGLRVASDVRDLNPPAVLVTPPAMHFRFADGTWDADWTVLAVAPGSGTSEALKTLSDLIDATRAALGGQPVTATPYTLTVDGQSDPLPAYQVTWSARVR